MPRNQVDENKDRTCSSGLHFCSYDYLAHFGGERIMVLKINPKDVVSIPTDYNNSKGRCARYLVVDELATNDYDSMPSSKLKEDFTTDYGSDADDLADPVDDWDGLVVEQNYTGGFTYAQVQAIREACNRGEQLTVLSRQYDTSPRTIGRIRDGKR